MHGIKDGKPAVVEMAAVGRMRDLTGAPHAVATLMVGRRESPRRASSPAGGSGRARSRPVLLRPRSKELGLNVEIRVS